MKNLRTDTVKKIGTGVDDTFTITKQHIQYNMYTHSITHTIKCIHTTQHIHRYTHIDILNTNTQKKKFYFT